MASKRNSTSTLKTEIGSSEDVTTADDPPYEELTKEDVEAHKREMDRRERYREEHIEELTRDMLNRPVRTVLNSSDILPGQTDLPGSLHRLDAEQIARTPILKKLFVEVRTFKKLYAAFSQLLDENPEISNPKTDEERKVAEDVDAVISRARHELLAQLTICKALNHNAVMHTRKVKLKTAGKKQEVDHLRLGLQNLSYEEQSLRREISAAKTYDHPYERLPMITRQKFLETFPTYKDSPETEIMFARIDYEHHEREKLEEERQSKIKEKQALAAEVKARKEDLDKLDANLENFMKAAEPIQKTLSKE